MRERRPLAVLSAVIRFFRAPEWGLVAGILVVLA